MRKLPIKEFLKPDWRKILIFIIILIFSILDVGVYEKYSKSLTIISGLCVVFELGGPECITA
jgi:hypothetical protein